MLVTISETGKYVSQICNIQIVKVLFNIVNSFFFSFVQQSIYLTLFDNILTANFYIQCISNLYDLIYIFVIWASCVLFCCVKLCQLPLDESFSANVLDSLYSIYAMRI